MQHFGRLPRPRAPGAPPPADGSAPRASRPAPPRRPRCHHPHLQHGHVPGSMSRTLQYKKITKPLLERKRRARINRCLDELKELMVGAFEAEGENVAKLEKADILELTVRHLQKLHEAGRLAPPLSPPPGGATTADAVAHATRFQAGFSRCAAEAVRYLLTAPGLDAELGRRLVRHLAARCLGPAHAPASPSPSPSPTPSPTPSSPTPSSPTPSSPAPSPSPPPAHEDDGDDAGPVWRPW
ncbi:Enhancer of split mgamma protein [Gryllus bimaculatus]|nr:Enhancer of split mgamma protein [Gryllus bimaculatus]